MSDLFEAGFYRVPRHVDEIVYVFFLTSVNFKCAFQLRNEKNINYLLIIIFNTILIIFEKQNMFYRRNIR